MAITEKIIKNVPKYQEDPETGEIDYSKTPTLVDEVEVRADGKDKLALKDVFEKSSWIMQNRIHAKRRKYGVMKISDPQGNVGEIFGHEEEKYRKLGWGRKATKFSLTVSGFGEGKKLGPGKWRLNNETKEWERVR